MTIGWREATEDPDRGLARLERAAALAEERGLVNISADAHLARALCAVWTHRYGAARTAFDEAMAYCRMHGNEIAERYVLAGRAELELDQGRWADAIESAMLVLRRGSVSTYPTTAALAVVARVRARRGDPGVLPILAEERALAESTGELPRLSVVAVAEAEAAWLRDDAAQAREATAEALELAVRVKAGGSIALLQAWRKRAGVKEPVHALADGPCGAAEMAARHTRYLKLFREARTSWGRG